MRVLVSGGGTGGHIYPALAIATSLRREYQAEILFLGSDDGLEKEIVPAAGFALATVKAGKLRRYVSLETITGVMRVPLGMFQAIEYRKEVSTRCRFYKRRLCRGSGCAGSASERSTIIDAPAGCSAQPVEQAGRATGNAHFGGLCRLAALLSGA